MLTIRDITPTNLNREREKFLAQPNFNPQFTYPRPIEPNQLTAHGLPRPELIDKATQVLSETFYGRNSDDLVLSQGPLCTQRQVEATTHSFLKLHQLEKRIEVKFSHSYHSRASISPSLLKIRLPLNYRKESLLSMLYHEVGTHALRSLNYEEQPWHKKKTRYGFRPYLRTEEGLASLHSLLPKSEKVNWHSCLWYLCVDWAQKYSFLEVWHRLGQYLQNPLTRWRYTTRAKRGLTDTSQPGGFTKDLVYFEGMHLVWRWLRDHQFNPSELYLGKLHHLDTDQARQLNPSFHPRLPSFFTSSPKLYAKQMQLIGTLNHLD